MSFTARLRLALQNRRFQLLLALVAAVPIGASYLLRQVLLPVLTLEAGHDDFLDVNLRSAGLLKRGLDPFGACHDAGCFTAAGVDPYPPVVAWALQPLTGLSPGVANTIALIACQLCLAGFLVLVLRNLLNRGWAFRILLVLLAISWWPVINDVEERQLQMLVLLATGVFVDAEIRARPLIAGAAAGAGAAIKLMLAPLLAMALWLRWWRVAIAGLGTWLALWLLAPGYLPEYLFRVLPGLAGGTGVARNDAPTGALARLFEPASIYGQAPAVPGAVRVLAVLIAAGALLVTAELVRRRPRADPRLRVAALVAVLPLATTLAWPGHLVVLLAPIFILVDQAICRRLPMPGLAAAAAWVLIGPVQVLLLQLSVLGSTPEAVLQVLADSGLAGIVILWLACLRLLRGG